jgi:cell division protein FtsB
MERRTPEPPPPSSSPSTPVNPGSVDPTEAADRLNPLDTLPIAGITRRRVGFLVAALVSVWIVVVFARQVGEASTASARAHQLAADNAQLAASVEALQHELQVIERPEYVSQQARGVQLGATNERPFSLAPGAPPLAADAPGSAAARLGSHESRESPLEAWLSLLFGPSPTQ